MTLAAISDTICDRSMKALKRNAHPIARTIVTAAEKKLTTRICESRKFVQRPRRSHALIAKLKTFGMRNSAREYLAPSTASSPSLPIT